MKEYNEFIPQVSLKAKPISSNHNTIHDSKIFWEISMWYNFPDKSLEYSSEYYTNSGH